MIETQPHAKILLKFKLDFTTLSESCETLFVSLTYKLYEKLYTYMYIILCSLHQYLQQILLN